MKPSNNSHAPSGSSWGRLLLAAIAAISLLIPAVLADGKEPKEKAVQYVSVSTLRKWLAAKSPTFLDVREADEFSAGHVRGAVNIRYEEVASLAERLPHTQPIVLYCIHSSHRAPAAAKTLQALGFTNAYVLEGGIVAWQVAGETIVAGQLAQKPMILMKTQRCEQLKEADPTGIATEAVQ